MLHPLTREDDRRQKMAALYPRTHGPDCPDRYRAIAEWWRLHAEEVHPSSAAECLRYAANQDALASDMEARHQHYRTKPIDLTNWQWMQR